MFKVFDYYKLQNMEDRLERLETCILKAKKISRYDLQELEGLANKIMALRLEISGVELNLE